jgi:hypothetical protein
MHLQADDHSDRAKVFTAENWDEIMKFIIDNRPIVVYQFWIDTAIDIDSYNMLYSKVIPAPDSFAQSEV